MGNKVLYTTIGAIIGLAVGVVPTIKEIAKSGGDQRANPLVYITTFIGSIIVGAAIGNALCENQPTL